ncbi:MAG: hypothetical protein ACRCVN_05930 [Spirochaetia bacterium]
MSKSNVFIKGPEVTEIYHGTKAFFSDFKMEKAKDGSHGKGAYFTEDQKWAKGYAGPEGRIRSIDIANHAFLDLRDGHVTRPIVNLISKKIKGRKFPKYAEVPQTFFELSRHFGFNFCDLLTKRSGKAGIILTPMDGPKSKPNTFLVTNEKYLNDKGYREKANHLGGDPLFIAKLNKMKGKLVGFDKLVQKAYRKNKIIAKSGDMRKGYVEGVRQLKNEIGISITKMKNSLLQIEMGNRPSWQTPEWSVKKGIELAVIDKLAQESVGKYCIMMGTNAENPDLDHQLLAGEVMSCEDAFEEKRRFGCQCEIKVLD